MGGSEERRSRLRKEKKVKTEKRRRPRGGPLGNLRLSWWVEFKESVMPRVGVDSQREAESEGGGQICWRL